MSHQDILNVELADPSQPLPSMRPSWPRFAVIRINGQPLCGYLSLLPLVAFADLDVDYPLATCDCGEPGCSDVFDDLSQEVHPDFVSWLPGPTTAAALHLAERRYVFDRRAFQAEIARLRAYLFEHCQHPELGPAIEELTFSMADQDEARKLTPAELENHITDLRQDALRP
ncbi:hypothetical protein ACOTC5_29930 [Achromobacter xylosoxidans]